MSVLVKHFGKVQDGQLLIYDYESYEMNLRLLEGKEIELIVDEKFVEVSEEQHGYYRGVIIPTMLQDENFGGWSKEEIHSYLANRFLGEDTVKIIGEQRVIVRIVPSTANIGKKRMAKFVTEVRDWLATIGIIVKDPEHYVIKK